MVCAQPLIDPDMPAENIGAHMTGVNTVRPSSIARRAPASTVAAWPVFVHDTMRRDGMTGGGGEAGDVTVVE